MNDLAPTPGEQPVPQSIVTPAGEQQAPGVTSNDLRNLGQDALLALINAEENGVPPELPQTPPAVTVAPETTPGAQPAVDPAAAAPAEGEPGSADSIKRVSVRSLPADDQKLVAQAVALVRDGKAVDFVAAVAQLTGTANPEATPAAAAADSPTPPVAATPVPQAPAPAPEVARIESQIADLRAQREQADLDFNKAEVNRLTTEIEDLLPELVEARRNAVTRQSEVATYQQQYQSSVDAVEAKYPDLQDDNSKFTRYLNAVVIAARSENDPALNDPNHLMKFADEVAADLYQSGKVTPPPPRPSRPVGAAVAPGNSQVSRPSMDQVKQAIKNATPQELGAVIFTE